jgi:hypothetical protein
MAERDELYRDLKNVRRELLWVTAICATVAPTAADTAFIAFTPGG